MKKLLSMLFVVMIMTVLICPAFAADDSILIYMVAAPGSPYYAQCDNGIKDAAVEMGGDIETVFVGGVTLDGIRDAFEKSIGADPDGIMTLGLTYQLMAEPIHLATEQGIKVFLFDSYIAGSDAIAYYGTDNQSAGYLAAETLAERIGGKGEVAIITATLDTESSQGLRRVGFMEYIEKNYPDIKIVATEKAIDLNEGADKASQLLNAYPNLTAIFCTDGQTPKGVASIIEERELGDKVTVVCFDEDEQILNEIIAGNITATIMQDAYGMAHDCAVAMIKMIRGEETPDQDIYYSDCLVIDGENATERLDAFLASNAAKK